MNRFFLISLFSMLTVCQVFADGYGFLTVQKSDGSQMSFVADGLTITFADGQFKAVADGKETQLALSELQKMFFSESSTGIESIVQSDAAVELFTLSGVRIGRFSSAASLPSNLEKGVYVVKTNGKTSKIAVK
ncbi:MAG: hypothetical protein ACI4UC_05460 [Alloprevotella sp.]